MAKTLYPLLAFFSLVNALLNSDVLVTETLAPGQTNKHIIQLSREQMNDPFTFKVFPCYGSITTTIRYGSKTLASFDSTSPDPFNPLSSTVHTYYNASTRIAPSGDLFYSITVSSTENLLETGVKYKLFYTRRRELSSTFPRVPKNDAIRVINRTKASIHAEWNESAIDFSTSKVVYCIYRQPLSSFTSGMLAGSDCGLEDRGDSLINAGCTRNPVFDVKYLDEGKSYVIDVFAEDSVTHARSPYLSVIATTHGVSRGSVAVTQHAKFFSCLVLLYYCLQYYFF